MPDSGLLAIVTGPTFNADGPHYHFDIFPRNASILGWSDGSTESETEGEETADALWIAIIEVAAVVGRGWKLEYGDVISVSPLLERPNSR